MLNEVDSMSYKLITNQYIKFCDLLLIKFENIVLPLLVITSNNFTYNIVK